MTEYRKLFNDKLAKTDNFDEAFIKAIWKAYLDGVEAGKSDAQNVLDHIVDVNKMVLTKD